MPLDPDVPDPIGTGFEDILGVWTAMMQLNNTILLCSHVLPHYYISKATTLINVLVCLSFPLYNYDISKKVSLRKVKCY